MNSCESGSAAFPVVLPNGDCFGHGVTVRQYFAARAPADPQPWFTPTMPTERPRTMEANSIEDETTREDVRVAIQCNTDPTTPAGAEWFAQDQGTYRAQVAWDKERARLRLVQWPWAWADAVLAAETFP